MVLNRTWANLAVQLLDWKGIFFYNVNVNVNPNAQVIRKCNKVYFRHLLNNTGCPLCNCTDIVLSGSYTNCYLKSINNFNVVTIYYLNEYCDMYFILDKYNSNNIQHLVIIIFNKSYFPCTSIFIFTLS